MAGYKLACFPLIIALGGRAQHGKTTMSARLKEHLERKGLRVAVTSFAAVPKKMLAVLGLTDEQLYGSEKEKPTSLLLGKTPRFAMQSLATEWGREMLYDDIWIDAWERSVYLLRDVDVVLVDDLRHEAEIKRLKKMGAIIVEIYRPAKMPTTQFGWLKHWLKQHVVHSSERLDFRSHDVTRITVSENARGDAVKELLALVPEM